VPTPTGTLSDDTEEDPKPEEHKAAEAGESATSTPAQASDVSAVVDAEE
jgi:hypothetical protein